MRELLVSVIIPTYNRAQLVCEAIENVLEQTYQSIELIVVDDGSTDDTHSRLRQFGNRIRVISQANAGPAIARNKGIEAARGALVSFQDSDDLWKPTKIERQVDLLKRVGTSVPCCLANAEFHNVYNDGQEHTSFEIACLYPEHRQGIWTNVADVLATRFVLFNQNVVIWRQALEKAGGFDANLKYYEDYDLPFRLALEGPWAYIREPLVIYRGGAPNSFSQLAHKDAIGLMECEVKIISRILSRVEAGEGTAHLRNLLEAKLKACRRWTKAEQLRRMDSWTARLTGEALTVAENCKSRIIRNLGLWPKMNTVPVLSQA